MIWEISGSAFFIGTRPFSSTVNVFENFFISSSTSCGPWSCSRSDPICSAPIWGLTPEPFHQLSDAGRVILALLLGQLAVGTADLAAGVVQELGLEVAPLLGV